MEDQLFYKSVSEKCKQRSEKCDVSVMGIVTINCIQSPIGQMQIINS